MRRLGLALIIVLPGIVLGSWLAWLWTPQKELNLLIIDKTMVNELANEHRALTWLLTQERYVTGSGSYEPGENSVGFKPTGDGTYQITGFEARDSSELDRLAASYDAAYVADAYGIYEVTWFQEHPELGPVTRPGRKIYGGLHPNDIRVLRSMKDRGKLVIAEFSCLGPPTPPDVRRDMESLLGLRWTGWTGKYFATLDSTGTDLPDWVVSLYRQANGGRWPFRDAPGIVLSHIDERIMILRYPEDLERQTPEVAAIFEHTDRFGTPFTPLPYPFWFDIVEPDTTMQTVAYFVLPIKQALDTVLTRMGIPRIFPAVLEEVGTQQTYYFAGDFAEYPEVNDVLAHFKGVRTLRTQLYDVDDPASRSEFYWTFYYPMVRTILRTSARAQR